VTTNPDPNTLMSYVGHAHVVGASQLPSSNDTPSNIAQAAVARVSPLIPVVNQQPQSPSKRSDTADPRISPSFPLFPATSPLSTPPGSIHSQHSA
jgi:hypothetical protein